MVAGDRLRYRIVAGVAMGMLALLAFSTDGRADPRTVGYFIEWGVYARNYEPADIPAASLTHINFAFVQFTASGELKAADEEADFNKLFPAKNGFPSEKGLYNRFRSLKKLYPAVKILISLGGWGSGGSFTPIAADAALRATFASSCANWISEQGLDGVDIDWEYPQAAEKENFVALLQAVRNALDAKGQADGKTYLLTIAGPAGVGSMGGYDFPAVANVVDWINIMGYDYFGSWNTTTGFNAPLYEDPANPSGDKTINTVDYTVAAYLNGGVPAEKLVLGLPLYGRSWENVPDTDNGLYQSGQAGPATGENGNWEGGVFDYWRIVQLQQEGYVSSWNDSAKVPWLYGPCITAGVGNGMFVSYDDRQSIGLKIDYLQSKNLSGAMFWELSGDVRDASASTSIVPYVAEQLGVSSGGPAVVANLLWHKKDTGKTACWDLNASLQLEDTRTENGWKFLAENTSMPSPWWYAAFVDLEGEGTSVDGQAPATEYLVFWVNSETRRVMVWRLQEDYSVASEEAGAGWEYVSASANPAGYAPRGVIRHNGRNFMFWQNNNTGRVVWWRLDDQGRLQDTQQGSGWDYVSETVLASHWTLLTPMTVNGGLTLLWRGDSGDSQQQIVSWKLDDTGYLVNATEGDGWYKVSETLLPKGLWRLVDVGNFDARTTLFWQNTSTRKLVYWTLGGDGRLLGEAEDNGWGFLAKDVELSPAMLALGLLDAAGEPALIWMNTGTGRTVYWKLESPGVLQSTEENNGWGVIAEAESATGAPAPSLSWRQEFLDWAKAHFTPRLESEFCLLCQPE